MKIIRILKPIPVQPHERIEPFGLYKVFKENGDFYLIESGATGKGIWIKKEEAEEVKKVSMAFTYREMATCIKFLERMKYKLIMGHYNEVFEQGCKIKRSNPIEYYFLNEFPFNSAFCYIFRKFRVKGTAPKDVHVCFCPMKPYENTQWPISRGKHLGSDGEEVSYARRACNLYKGKKSGKIKPRSEQKMLEMIEEISVYSIMKHLKKIKITKVQRKKMAMLWYFHIKHRVEMWELQNKRRFL